HDADALGAAVGHDAHIVLLADVGPFLDEQAADLLALGAGLVRDQLHAQDLAGQLAHLVDGAGQLDAPALATATGMDLGLHDPDGPAQLGGGGHGFVDRVGRDAAGYRHAE